MINHIRKGPLSAKKRQELEDAAIGFGQLRQRFDLLDVVGKGVGNFGVSQFLLGGSVEFGQLFQGRFFVELIFNPVLFLFNLVFQSEDLDD